MYIVWVTEQKVTFALYIINRLGFITGVFTARYRLSPQITQIRFVLKF
jgi:hypothetical protein